VLFIGSLFKIGGEENQITAEKNVSKLIFHKEN